MDRNIDKRKQRISIQEKKRRENQKKFERSMERMTTAIFSLYSLVLWGTTVFWYKNLWVEIVIAVTLIIIWFLHIFKIQTFAFRCQIITLACQIVICIYATQLHDLLLVLPFYLVLGIAIAFIGQGELMLGFIIGNGVLFLTYLMDEVNSSRLLDTYLFSKFHVQILLEFINAELFFLLLMFWLKKRKLNTDKIECYIQQMEHTEQRKDAFLEKLNYEFRVPITSICGRSELQLQQELAPQVHNAFLEIQKEGKKMQRLIGDILDFSELHSEHVEIKKEKYSVEQLIQESVQQIYADAYDKNIRVVTDYNHRIPSVLYGDEKKIRRVLRHVLENSLNYTKEGYILVLVDFREESYGVNLAITVMDSGVGIEDERQKHIFSELAEFDMHAKKKTVGMGLGLAISSVLVGKMGGIINMQSKYGVGTKVNIVIPQEVYDSTPLYEYKKLDDVKIGIYFDFENNIALSTRDAYYAILKKISMRLELNEYMFEDMQEVQRTNWYNYTHLLISLKEYQQAKDFFDKLSYQLHVIVIIEKEGDNAMLGAHISCLRRPFSTLDFIRKLDYQETEKKYATYIRKILDTSVLVVDDNAMNLQVSASYLKRYGLEVDTATSGREALEMLDQTQKYKMVFLDYMMPEMDGVETLKRIRSRDGNYYQAVSLIALTAHVVAGTKEYLLHSGFNGFLDKPLNYSVLEQILQHNIQKEKIIWGEHAIWNNIGKHVVSVSNAVSEKTEETKKKQQEIEAAGSEEVGKTQTTMGKVSVQETVKEETFVGKVSAQETVKKQTSVEMVGTEEERKGQMLEQVVSTEETEGRTDMEEKLQIGDLDMESGVMYCGNMDNLIEILRICGDTAQENMDKIVGFYGDKNWKDYTILVHGVKSSMKSVGANQLSEMAKALEMAGKAEDVAFIDANQQAFMEEYVRVNNFLHAHPAVYKQEKQEESVSASVVTPIDLELLEEKTKALENATYEFDGEKMRGILEELQSYSLGGVHLDKPILAMLRKVEMRDYMSAYDTFVKVTNDLKNK